MIKSEVINVKKDLLFVIDSLECAGAEKSLVTLLSLLDYSKYNVDLMLFGHGGSLQELVPEKVNILKPLKYTQFAALGLKKAVFKTINAFEIGMLLARLKYSLKLRSKTYNNAQKARLFWESVDSVIEKNMKNYDIAISYAQGIPTFYVAEKVHAKKKLAWVNVSYRLDETEKEFQKRFYDHLDTIVAVSDSTKDVFLETFPFYRKKIDVIYDINDANLISNMATLSEGYQDGFEGIRILTVGRLAHQKGYDIALEACKKLKDAGIKFRWYALGKGPLEKDIKELIIRYGLTEDFVLMGVKPNPYPYIKKADIYVQTSRFEGFGLAIAEARMLNIPVVTTKFDAVFNQMIDENNGLVVEMEPEAVYEGIKRLINDDKLRKSIIHNLSVEKKGNLEELMKFYKLID